MSNEPQEPLQYESIDGRNALSKTLVYAGLILFGIYEIYGALFYLPGALRPIFRGSATSDEELWVYGTLFLGHFLGGCALIYFSKNAVRMIAPMGGYFSTAATEQILVVGLIVVALIIFVLDFPHFILQIAYSYRVLPGRSRTFFEMFVLIVTDPTHPLMISLIRLTIGALLLLRPGWIAGKILRYSRLEVPKPG